MTTGLRGTSVSPYTSGHWFTLLKLGNDEALGEDVWKIFYSQIFTCVTAKAIIPLKQASLLDFRNIRRL